MRGHGMKGGGSLGEEKWQNSCRSAGSGKITRVAASRRLQLGQQQNSRRRSNSCQIRQLEEGEAELGSREPPKAQPGL